MTDGNEVQVTLPLPVDMEWSNGDIVRHREPSVAHPSIIVDRNTTVAQQREHVAYLRAELSDHLAALELLELEGGTESDALLAKLRRWVDEEADELIRDRKIAVWLRDGAPEFQYSHDQARYEVLAEVAKMIGGPDE